MTVNNNVVVVEDLHKTFRLPHDKHTTLKQTVLNWRRRSYEELHVLKGIDFNVKKGEFFGIVGRNGSGKSTLLKTMAGIYQPDKGGALIKGHLTPFIELGIGFNYELTGRDNIYLNGAILGLSRDEIEKRYKEIVDFAELERFMDQRLKNYSSGMQVRLAFSIATQAHRNILLLDEVLAVGDENFQNKCVDYFTQVKKDPDQTVILVTHDMGWIEKFCDRAIVIEAGKLVDGAMKPHETHMQYSKINQQHAADKATEEEPTEPNRWGNKKVEVKKFELNGQSKNKIFKTGERLSFSMNLQKNNLKPDAKLLVGLGIHDETGTYLYGPNSKGENIKAETGKIAYTVPELKLSTGRYFASVGLFSEDGTETYDFIDKAVSFKVINEESDTNRGKVVLDGNWEY